MLGSLLTSCLVFQQNVRERPALSFHKRQLHSAFSRFPEWQMSELSHCSIRHSFYPNKYWKHIYCNIEGIRVFRKGKSDPSLSCAAFQHSPGFASAHQQLKSLTINKPGWDQCSWVCSCCKFRFTAVLVSVGCLLWPALLTSEISGGLNFTCNHSRTSFFTAMHFVRFYIYRPDFWNVHIENPQFILMESVLAFVDWLQVRNCSLLSLQFSFGLWHTPNSPWKSRSEGT